jgi:phosphatidylserine decarboxylase
MVKIVRGITILIIAVIFISSCFENFTFNIIAFFIFLILIALYYFFRDPERIPAPGDLFVSPADGKVLPIKNEGGWLKISVFIHLYNIHVQRVPYPGKVVSIKRTEGHSRKAFLNVFKNNKQVVTSIDTKNGSIILKQTAGILIKKIITYVNEGDILKIGERFGCIVFGSQVELWLPSDKVEILVKEGQKVLAGATPVAKPK